jgi:hypothetical protein
MYSTIAARPSRYNTKDKKSYQQFHRMTSVDPGGLPPMGDRGRVGTDAGDDALRTCAVAGPHVSRAARRDRGRLVVATADPLNPYRNGTTHDAVLVHTTGCAEDWWATLQGGHYRWKTDAAPSPSLGPGPLYGRLHILRQRVPEIGSAHSAFAATFATGGVTLKLVGGREPWMSDLRCSLP